jgi:hypothetical protein
LSDFDGNLSGSYKVTLIGWEAGYDNAFGTDNDGILLAKFDYGMIGDWSTVVDFDADDVYFKEEDGSQAYFNAGSSDIEMYTLQNDISIHYNAILSYPALDLQLRAGDIVAGFDDTPANDDDNHDDLIVAFRAVPIPAPALLLGLGLLGFVGIRRRVLQ